MWYNGHKESQERRGAGTGIYMTKGRKTTQSERAEIVAFCMEHGKDYPLTIQTEIEKLRAQNKILQAQIKDKEIEIALLKKLRELEGWDA